MMGSSGRGAGEVLAGHGCWGSFPGMIMGLRLERESKSRFPKGMTERKAEHRRFLRERKKTTATAKCNGWAFVVHPTLSNGRERMGHPHFS